MPSLEDANIYGVQLRESLDDGSDFSNADADYRILFLGEDGYLHAKDSAGTVTDPYDVSGSGLGTGTSFPGGPSTGDRFRRSDIDYFIFFYDGTRWVTEQMFTLTGGVYLATVDAFSVFPMRSDLQCYLVDWDVLTYVSGAATWVATLQTFDTEYDGFSTLDSVSTAAQNVAEMYRTTRDLDDVVNATAAHGANVVRGIRIFWDEQTGSASFIGQAVIRYRVIAT